MSILSDALQHHPEIQPFWTALGEGRFLIKHCRGCGRAHWYPRAICPHCASADTEWREASGRGAVYSYSVMRQAKEPFAIAYVTLEEGPTMMTNIVDSDLEAIRIGKPVEIAIRRQPEGEALPLFRLT